jgi:hypothetical protein
MRRLGVSIFLLFYIFSVAGLTLRRTEEWASQNADKFKRPRSHDRITSGEAHKNSPHQSQTKLFEDTSVLDPVLRTVETPDLESEVYSRLTGFIPDANLRALSSRAPPRFL